jgi:hypothetical protein
MHFIQAPSRARRALSLLAVAGLLGLTAVLAGVRPASAIPLLSGSFFAVDSDGNAVSSVWTTEAVTLTVTAHVNIGSDRLEIIDPFFNVVKSCSAGQQSCSTALISHDTVAEYSYFAYLLSGNQVVAELSDSVSWVDFPVSLHASQTTVPVGQAVTLTATTQRKVDYSIWYIGIVDLTDGHQVCTPIMGSGTTCSGTVTENVATTHKFAAYVANFAKSDVRSQSAGGFVTWSNDGWQISLTAPEATFTGSEAVTATANMSVSSPSPFWIEIFDETTGQRIWACGSGASCTDPNFKPSRNGDDLVAFVSPLDTAFPPSGIEASSNIVHTVYDFLQ